MEYHIAFRFSTGSWEIWVSIQTIPPRYVQAYTQSSPALSGWQPSRLLQARAAVDNRIRFYAFSPEGCVADFVTLYMVYIGTEGRFSPFVRIFKCDVHLLRLSCNSDFHCILSQARAAVDNRIRFYAFSPEGCVADLNRQLGLLRSELAAAGKELMGCVMFSCAAPGAAANT